MQKRINSRVPALTAGLFAFAFALDTGPLFAASDCAADPGRATAQGGHWYYHIDRSTGRKCWHLTEADPPARLPQAEPAPVPVPVQPPPDATRQQQPFTSFFSSLGFSTASVGVQPDPANRDPRGAVVQPDAPRVDQVVPKRRQHADAKPAPAPKPDRQASARPANAPADQPRAASLSQAERDALFQEYLRWKQNQ